MFNSKQNKGNEFHILQKNTDILKSAVTQRDTYIYKSKPKNEGLTTEEAAQRFKVYGENALVEKRKKSAVSIFLSQFNDFMIWVLLGATAISALLGETADAITIIAIVIINGILGFIQEYRTEKSMEALKELTAPVVKVIRDGKPVTVSSKEIVPDDVVILEAGDRVPADSLVVNASGMQVDESLLTGESIPVDKKAAFFNDKKAVIGSHENTVYMGTVITGGRGKAVVISTGMETEMGKIADLLQGVEDEQTPLQERLDKMGKVMVYGCLLACGVVTVTGILKGENIYTMFLTGVSLAVAAIPEGLPAIVTVSLTLGVSRMLKRNALIRRLPAVETLGCTNVICSDKTGTLTENKMTVRSIFCDGINTDVSGSGYEETGEFTKNGVKVNPERNPQLKLLFEASVCCNNSGLITEMTGGKVLQFKNRGRHIKSVSGDPTEIALLICAYKAGILKEDLDKIYTRVDEIAFDSNRKRMSVIVKHNGEYYVFVKGAPESTVELCSNIYSASGDRTISPAIKKMILAANENMAKSALRVLAVAYKKLTVLPSRITIQSLESGLTFLGLIGMIDPPRNEAIKAIEICKIAGIKPVMITGDHKETAIAIAKQLKLLNKESTVYTGSELDSMDDEELARAAGNAAVYARVTPKHKLRIVKAYKQNNAIVAMTGDGVNDAPAVKEADIGISMGKTGTDVTKEASSMVLLDDNFATIVAAVEEGRSIYDNIRKFIRYLLSCNLGEVLTMFLASLLSFPIPLLPIQILWVNLVTDGLPAIALGLDNPDTDIMLRPPRAKYESIFSQGLGLTIIIRGIFIGLCTLAIFALNLDVGHEGLIKARTMAFATLVMSQLIHVFECRSERHSIFEINFFSNIYLVLAVLISTTMLLVVMYIPVLQAVFQTVNLSFGDWVEVLLFSGGISLIVNLKTYIKMGR